MSSRYSNNSQSVAIFNSTFIFGFNAGFWCSFSLIWRIIARLPAITSCTRSCFLAAVVNAVKAAWTADTSACHQVLLFDGFFLHTTLPSLTEIVFFVQLDLGSHSEVSGSSFSLLPVSSFSTESSGMAAYVIPLFCSNLFVTPPDSFPVEKIADR